MRTTHKRDQFPNMAKLIRLKCHEKNITQIQLSPVIGSKRPHNGQIASHIQLGKQSVPLKHAKAVCDFLGITHDEFITAHLEDLKIKIYNALK